ncbi:hypothetical protein KKA47_02230 [bacterium]|nr:hypothetical protein [bacterium]
MFRPGDPEFVKTKKGEFSSKINITKQEFQDKSKDGTGCIDKNNGGGNHWPWDGFEDAHFSTEIPGNEALFNDSTLIWQPYKHE